ncbi:GPI-anchored adhesin-like protein [Perilla frutescens var. hirtella]|nr:GPI-anchored adhesin-like protein [Perilla frutescens var. hirtella]
MGCNLKEGVLLKLVEEMKRNVDSWRSSDDPKAAALLQIRSIIPVLEEGDLWPNRGFFLKVSDASHALYVSLSRKHNDMILANKLHLGQFIHVRKLETADPLPLLRGVTPIPGRRPCEGTPQDIVSPARLLRLLQPSSSSVVQKRAKMVRGGSSDSETSCRRSAEAEAEAGKATTRSSSASKARPGKTSYDRVDNNDSDADSVVAPTPPRASKRRSWSESEILGVKEIFDSSVVKNEMKLPFRSASANVSPVRSSRYDSSDDNSSSVSRNRGGGSAKTVIMKGSNRSHQVPATKAKNTQTMSHSLCNVVCDRKGAETRISWSSLPLNLVKHGKEVIKQRDGALQAAVDALQEACTSERLLNSLSTMSQFPLAEEGGDLQPFVDKFFNLQHDLSKTGLIMQSLTSIITRFTTPEAEIIGLERKKNANAWIKSAIALDLSTCIFSPQSSTSPPDPIRTPKQTSTCTKAKDKVKRDDHIPLVLGLKEEEERGEWRRGGAAAELASSLQDECKKLFLIYVEKYLDEVDRKSSLVEYDEEMAEMMCKVKMVGEWLDLSVNKEGCDCEVETYVRVRDKIYGILLKHVERTAMAFDRFKASL